MKEKMYDIAKIGSVSVEGKRIFALDFIRVFAMWIIIIYHFENILRAWDICINNKVLEKNIFSLNGIDMGVLGVSLFFIISGLALMYTNEKMFNCKKFFLKRFLAIYPLFWLSYTIVLIIRFLLYDGQVYESGIDNWKWILTILGFDGYFRYKGPNFYLIGEWFLAAIICTYVLFPFFRKILYHKYWKVWTILLIGIYFLVVTFYPFESVMEANIAVRFIDFYFGMLMIKEYKKMDLKWGIVSLIIFVVLTWVPFLKDCKYTFTFRGWSAFIVLFVLGNIIQNILKCQFVYGIFEMFSKYSFTIFLFHHRVQFDFFKKFLSYKFTTQSIGIAFIICAAITFFMAYITQNFWESIYVKYLKKNNIG